jgi:pantoate kinase
MPGRMMNIALLKGWIDKVEPLGIEVECGVSAAVGVGWGASVGVASDAVKAGNGVAVGASTATTCAMGVIIL